MAMLTATTAAMQRSARMLARQTRVAGGVEVSLPFDKRDPGTTLATQLVSGPATGWPAAQHHDVRARHADTVPCHFV
jgi:hypothetical protein